ncbi:MAG: hypothetical protein H7Z37_19025 [Pyrinomonadaceae bacterium]|nr:hypothetical protein [Pyrinomonadaceae bacterium]
MFSFISNFKHKAEMRESKDEILVGEIVRAMMRLGNPAIGFIANNDFQAISFKPLNNAVLNSIVIQLDRKTGSSMLQQAVLGSQATLMFQAEVKNYLADPDDLIKMYRTDFANIFRMPMLGDTKIDHQMNSVLATKKTLVNIDNYINQGEQSAISLMNLIRKNIADLQGKLAQYKKA